ncbi:hypothetical protein [Streptomyces sp. NPDC090798]|uniref:hypothetical protein n=1 Tax=Streptomyces sp. NPDC090798 TaxID=3365968 RepID=UPI00382E6851
MAPSAGGAAGDFGADFHDQDRFDQGVPASPCGGERPSRPRMPGPRHGEESGDRGAGTAGEGIGTADVLQALLVVVSRARRAYVLQGRAPARRYVIGQLLRISLFDG